MIFVSGQYRDYDVELRDSRTGNIFRYKVSVPYTTPIYVIKQELGNAAYCMKQLQAGITPLIAEQKVNEKVCRIFYTLGNTPEALIMYLQEIKGWVITPYKMADVVFDC